MSKIKHGQFFTEKDVFENNLIFTEFMQKNNLWGANILEPFAGKNNLINFLKKYKSDIVFSSYDIEPQSKEVQFNDSIKNWFYKGFDLVITNPPYLSKHSSKRMNIEVDFENYDDLYKLSLDRCIKNVRFTIAIIPTTLINSNRKIDKNLLDKLLIFQLLPSKENFNDTEHPVAIGYFDNQKNSDDFLIYEHSNLIASYKELTTTNQKILMSKNKLSIKFNVKGGNLCINTGDNTRDKTNIMFHASNWKNDNDVKQTDRHKVKLLVENKEITPQFIDKLNYKIRELRENNCDYLWASFKGVSRTGHFRKRLDFDTIKKIINAIL